MKPGTSLTALICGLLIGTLGLGFGWFAARPAIANPPFDPLLPVDFDDEVVAAHWLAAFFGKPSVAGFVLTSTDPNSFSVDLMDTNGSMGTGAGTFVSAVSLPFDVLNASMQYAAQTEGVTAPELQFTYEYGALTNSTGDVTMVELLGVRHPSWSNQLVALPMSAGRTPALGASLPAIGLAVLELLGLGPSNIVGLLIGNCPPPIPAGGLSGSGNRKLCEDMAVDEVSACKCRSNKDHIVDIVQYWIVALPLLGCIGLSFPPLILLCLLGVGALLFQTVDRTRQAERDRRQCEADLPKNLADCAKFFP
jgi:hypothetical protein